MLFYKKAKIIHPDKAGPEFTAEFQDFKNAYERALRYLVDKKKAEDAKATDADLDMREDDEKFTQDNFDLFNFPKKNTDSFTIQVENQLADLWQECFEKLFGAPIVNKNKSSGTESGRVWKINYKHDEDITELTIHYYNKPVKSKKSKFLVQGGSHVAKYLCFQ